MNVTINGERRSLADETSIEQLIEQLGLGGKRLAVEVNLDIVPRSEYAAHRLGEGDRVEIVQAIGGGAASSPPTRFNTARDIENGYTR